MADYDVGALALVVPATSGPKSTYRPAVSVRNNGLHDALASGYIRIYSAGLLAFESELYSGTITPGNTGNAQAVDYWTPAVEGFYTCHAYLSTPLDQVESNNMLAPVTIEITGAEPPTPPTVPAHAAQHEEDGSDELSIDGLKGRAADPQDALAHAAQHQAGGSDALNVGSLQGTLAQDQPAQVHSNTRHDPPMATSAELTAHQGSIAVHTAATNLANRETTGPQTGLVPWVQLASGSEFPAGDDNGLRSDRIFGHVKATNIGDNLSACSLIPGPEYSDLHSITAPATWMHDHMVMEISFFGRLSVDNLGSLDIRLRYGASSWLTINIPGTSDPDRHFCANAVITGVPTDLMTGMIEWIDEGGSTHEVTRRMNVKNTLVENPNAARTWSIQARLNSGSIESHFSIWSAFSHSIRPQP
jgi:hypothetical protein